VGESRPGGVERHRAFRATFGNESSRELKGEVASMNEWSSYTPEGRPLVVRRERAGWVAKCGDGPEARSELLDLALIGAIHRDHDVVGHAPGLDYGKWARETADSIEREYTEKR
jgi:hypothetical protein